MYCDMHFPDTFGISNLYHVKRILIGIYFRLLYTPFDPLLCLRIETLYYYYYYIYSTLYISLFRIYISFAYYNLVTMAQSLTRLSCLLETFCKLFIRRQNGVSPRRAAFTGYNSGKDIMFQNISRSLTLKSGANQGAGGIIGTNCIRR